MKTFTNLITSRKFITIIIVTMFFPFVYAADQVLQADNGTNTMYSSVLIPENTVRPIYSTGTSFDIKEPVVEAKFILKEKVRSGLVQTINNDDNSLVIKVGDKLLNVPTNATTTYYFGDGEKASIDDIEYGAKIYIFGYIKSDNSAILASKVVIANRSKLLRI